MPWTSGHEVLLHFVNNVGRLGFHSFHLLPFASGSNSLAGLEIYAHSVHRVSYEYLLVVTANTSSFQQRISLKIEIIKPHLWHIKIRKKTNL